MPCFARRWRCCRNSSPVPPFPLPAFCGTLRLMRIGAAFAVLLMLAPVACAQTAGYGASLVKKDPQTAEIAGLQAPKLFEKLKGDVSDLGGVLEVKAVPAVSQ